MEPSEFVNRWGNLVRRLGLSRGKLVTLPSVRPSAASSISSYRFLAEAGLPERAAPCLRFAYIAEGLKPVYEVYGAPTDWEDEDHQWLKPYLMLGSDAGDNPICLDTANQERIVWLDHEGFWAVQFVNSSVAQLAECLLVYAEMTEA